MNLQTLKCTQCVHVVMSMESDWSVIYIVYYQDILGISTFYIVQHLCSALCHGRH